MKRPRRRLSDRKRTVEERGYSFICQSRFREFIFVTDARGKGAKKAVRLRRNDAIDEDTRPRIADKFILLRSVFDMMSSSLEIGIFHVRLQSHYSRLSEKCH